MFLVNPVNPGYFFPVLVALARVGVQGTFTSVWITHPKMFPTLFAVTSIGISNIFSRSVVILAPMVAEIGYPTPMVIFTVINLIAAVSSLFLID